jgi:hypothetical protein
MLYKAIKAGAAGKLIEALMPVLKPKLFDPGFRAYEGLFVPMKNDVDSIHQARAG